MFMGQRCLHLLLAAVTWVKGGRRKGAPKEEMVCHILVDIYKKICSRTGVQNQ